MSEYKVSIDQLRVGVFVKIDLKWFAHPFLSNSFKITNPSMIDTLRDLGVEKVVCVVEKSEVLPLSPNQNPVDPALPVPPPVQDEEMKRLWAVKNEKIEQLKRRRQNVENCEKRFQSGVNTVKNVMRNIHTGSAESVAEADELLGDLIDSLLLDKESAVQLVNSDMGSQDAFYHSLNISVLSMMLGREAGCNAGLLRLLGLGALFHDVGKIRVPKNILSKTGPLTPAESNFLQLHPKYGEDIVTKVADFPKESADIVLHHHERCDGKGYPDRLSGTQINVLTRIAAIANTYDNYCNKTDPKDSLTPYEALSRMFALEKDAFDKDLLALFIQCLGVYAPGTIVKLSNGMIGLVISVTRQNPLKPSLVIFDPEVPKEEAIIFDLKDEPSLSIERSIRPLNLDPEIFNYLNPRARITYYVADSDSPTGKSGSNPGK
jgi:putative nucleotidyltransferase with HDIG domain